LAILEYCINQSDNTRILNEYYFDEWDNKVEFPLYSKWFEVFIQYFIYKVVKLYWLELLT
jgi:hypothetical protein